jgi:hypothetical protein
VKEISVTREEARDKMIRAHNFDEWRTGDELDRIFNWLERAGLLKFDEPRDTLVRALTQCVAEVESRDSKACLIGRLTPYGAGTIVADIERLGFKIVK